MTNRTGVLIRKIQALFAFKLLEVKMKHNEFEGLYADDETYEDYMNRKLLESVQHKPKEDTTMSQYYNYEVEDEKTENNKSLGFTCEILATAFSLLFFGGLVGIILWIIVGG